MPARAEAADSSGAATAAAPEVQQRRELRAKQMLERAVQRDAASRAREEEKAQRWREREREREHREQQWRERKRRWAVSEERREEERPGVRRVAWARALQISGFAD